MLPWVSDGIRVDEALLMSYVRDRAHADPTAPVVQGRDWLDDDPTWIDVRMVQLEMLVLIADAVDHNPALAQTLRELPRIAGGALGDLGMAFYLVQIADRSVESALTAAAFADRNESLGRPLLSSLSILAGDDSTTEQFDQLIAAPWFVDGLDNREVAFLFALRTASRDPELFGDLLRTDPNPTPTPTPTSTPTPTPTPTPSPDRPALVALYNATGGANWNNNTNWLSDEPIGQWRGVTANSNGRVTQLQLHNNQLSGEIPPALGSLINLESLRLSRNDLSGEIPPALGSLANLVSLRLYGNELSGEIPAALGNLANLQHLYLSSNELSGEIPSELGNLANLQHLSLSSDQLSGEIPSELGNLANLQRLSLL